MEKLFRKMMKQQSLPLRRLIGESLPRLRNWTDDQKRIIWENMIDYFSLRKEELPAEMRIFTINSSVNEVGYDETFCADVGIPYYNYDKHLIDIRAAIALWYYDNLIVKP